MEERGNGMEDKNLYNKIMLIVLCLIMILLCAGMYSWFHEGSAAPELEVPREKVQVLQFEFREPGRLPESVILEEDGICNF
ncbi:hypothetical protein [Lacrimispora sp.]|uniref:hypothetical protein n=1 Tax=Lacrimispora sp. TaxID=2719234 RepID=UPI00286DD24A|nr:hypothetical protein [Lacrimispora sp.]